MSGDTSMPRWAQVGLIGAAGVAAIVAIWSSSLGGRQEDLGPVDFAVGGPDALQFCDPLRPSFIAVKDKVSPVTMVETHGGKFDLKTATGKALGASSLMGGTLKLVAVDRALDRFEVGDAVYSGKGGGWTWSVPAGTTRVFADLTPVATGQEMYASCAVTAASPPGPAEVPHGLVVEVAPNVSAGQEFTVAVRSAPGNSPSLPVTLAAFDAGRQGPTGCVVRTDDSGDAVRKFRLTFNDAGKYVLWAVSGERRGQATIQVEP